MAYLMIDYVKILAVGSYKCYVWFHFLHDSEIFCLRITAKFYERLKKEGVPTAQSLRCKK